MDKLAARRQVPTRTRLVKIHKHHLGGTIIVLHKTTKRINLLGTEKIIKTRKGGNSHVKQALLVDKESSKVVKRIVWLAQQEMIFFQRT